MTGGNEIGASADQQEERRGGGRGGGYESARVLATEGRRSSTPPGHEATPDGGADRAALPKNGAKRSTVPVPAQHRADRPQSLDAGRTAQQQPPQHSAPDSDAVSGADVTRAAR